MSWDQELAVHRFSVGDTVARLKYILVRTPPNRGPIMPISKMAIGKKRAILCLRRVARASRAAGRWNTSEETTAHRNTPYHISEKEDKEKDNM